MKDFTALRVVYYGLTEGESVTIEFGESSQGIIDALKKVSNSLNKLKELKSPQTFPRSSQML